MRRLVGFVAALVTVMAIGCGTAFGSVTIGQSTTALTGVSPGSEVSICVASIQCTYYQGTSAIGTNPTTPRFRAPIDGMIVRWRLVSGSAGNSVRLRVIHPQSGGFVGAGTGPGETTDVGLSTYEGQRLPVKAGDTFGVDNSDSALMFAPAGLSTEIVEYWQQPASLPDGGAPSNPSNSQSSGAPVLQANADIVALPSSSGSAAACPGATGASVTVTPDPDPATAPKAVLFKIDGGAQQSQATAGNPGRATITVPPGVHSVEFWGQDTLGQQESVHHTLHAGCASQPALSNVSQSSRKWREGKRAPRISRKRPPVGTTFSFKLDQSASVQLRFAQTQTGRKVGGKCVAQRSGNRTKPRCKRKVSRGTLRFTGHAGLNRVVFQGRLPSGRKLPLGKYVLTITASNAGVGSSSATLRFKIVR